MGQGDAGAVAAIYESLVALWHYGELDAVRAFGMLDAAKVAPALRTKSEMVHVILTGRNAHSTIVDIAVTVTEMRR